MNEIFIRFCFDYFYFQIFKPIIKEIIGKTVDKSSQGRFCEQNKEIINYKKKKNRHR